mmetsp:Transcript_12068/g.30421  ORF Transcript_12068/g.30421 Transcript_12068/m.30421 type:complete len:211 (+) Transcript_12068:484-1116(+)
MECCAIGTPTTRSTSADPLKSTWRRRCRFRRRLRPARPRGGIHTCSPRCWPSSSSAVRAPGIHTRATTQHTHPRVPHDVAWPAPERPFVLWLSCAPKTGRATCTSLLACGHAPARLSSAHLFLSRVAAAAVHAANQRWDGWHELPKRGAVLHAAGGTLRATVGWAVRPSTLSFWAAWLHPLLCGALVGAAMVSHAKRTTPPPPRRESTTV